MSKRFKGLRNRSRSEDKAQAIADQEPSLKDLTAQGLSSRAADEEQLLSQSEPESAGDGTEQEADQVTDNELKLEVVSEPEQLAETLAESDTAAEPK